MMPVIHETSMPAAYVGIYYTFDISLEYASGGTIYSGDYTWTATVRNTGVGDLSLTSDYGKTTSGLLINGGMIGATNYIVGTPSKYLVGTHNVYVYVESKSNSGYHCSKTFSFTVKNPTPPKILTENLPDCKDISKEKEIIQLDSYSQIIEMTGDPTPSLSLVEGELPPGLKLSEDGRLYAE